MKYLCLTLKSEKKLATSNTLPSIHFVCGLADTYHLHALWLYSSTIKFYVLSAQQGLLCSSELSSLVECADYIKSCCDTAPELLRTLRYMWCIGLEPEVCNLILHVSQIYIVHTGDHSFPDGVLETVGSEDVWQRRTSGNLVNTGLRLGACNICDQLFHLYLLISPSKSVRVCGVDYKQMAGYPVYFLLRREAYILLQCVILPLAECWRSLSSAYQR